MKIVIDIDDKLYDRIKYLEPKADTMLDRLMRAIQNGTPLPKGHGRLIDISPYEQREAFATSWMLTRKIGQIVKNEECIPLVELPTVIEASESEDNE